MWAVDEKNGKCECGEKMRFLGHRCHLLLHDEFGELIQDGDAHGDECAAMLSVYPGKTLGQIEEKEPVEHISSQTRRNEESVETAKVPDPEGKEDSEGTSQVVPDVSHDRNESDYDVKNDDDDDGLATDDTSERPSCSLAAADQSVPFGVAGDSEE